MSSSNQPYDLDLDKRLAQALGIAPRIQSMASDNGGESGALFTNSHTSKGDIERFCADHPRYKCVDYEEWPSFTSNGNLLWRELEEWADARGCGWECSRQPGEEFGYHGFRIYGEFRAATTTLLAICEAWLAAIPIWKAAHPPIFKCHKCGKATDSAPDPPALTICEECCSEVNEGHDYKYVRDERDWFCKHCSKQQPEDCR